MSSRDQPSTSPARRAGGGALRSETGGYALKVIKPSAAPSKSPPRTQQQQQPQQSQQSQFQPQPHHTAGGSVAALMHSPAARKPSLSTVQIPPFGSLPAHSSALLGTPSAQGPTPVRPLRSVASSNAQHAGLSATTQPTPAAQGTQYFGAGQFAAPAASASAASVARLASRSSAAARPASASAASSTNAVIASAGQTTAAGAATVGGVKHGTSFGFTPFPGSFTSSFLDGPAAEESKDGGGSAGSGNRPDASPFLRQHYGSSSPGTGSSGPNRLRATHASSLAEAGPIQTQAKAFLASIDPAKTKLSYWMHSAATKANGGGGLGSPTRSPSPPLSASSSSGSTSELTSTRVTLVGKTIREFDRDLAAIPAKYHAIDSLLLGNNYIDSTLHLPLLFPRLKLLSLANNCVVDLGALESLGSLRELRNLYLEGNPVSHMPTYRAHVLGMIPSLHVLDGRRITAEDRARSAEVLARENSFLSSLMGTTLLIARLEGFVRTLKLNVEFIQFAYGRVGVFNRQNPPLYFGSLDSMDAQGLAKLCNDRLDLMADMDSRAQERCKRALRERVHAKWVVSFRHLLNLDATARALTDSWEASFSALLAQEQTHLQQLWQTIDKLKSSLHDRHTKLMQSAEYSSRVLQLPPTGHLGDVVPGQNSAALVAALGSQGFGGKKNKGDPRTERMEQRKREVHRSATEAALADAAHAIEGLPKTKGAPIPLRSPSRSPLRSPSTDYGEIDIDEAIAAGLSVGVAPHSTAVGGGPGASARARSASVDRARRVRALQSLKQRVTKGTGSFDHRPATASLSANVQGSPAPSSAASSASTKPQARPASSPAATTVRKAIPYATMASRVAARKPWEGRAGRSRTARAPLRPGTAPASRANSNSRTRAGRDGDSEQEQYEDDGQDEEADQFGGSEYSESRSQSQGQGQGQQHAAHLVHPPYPGEFHSPSHRAQSFDEQREDLEQSREFSPVALRQTSATRASQQPQQTQQQQQQQPQLRSHFLQPHAQPQHRQQQSFGNESKHPDDSQFYASVSSPSAADASHARPFTVNTAASAQPTPAAAMMSDATRIPSDAPQNGYYSQQQPQQQSQQQQQPAGHRISASRGSRLSIDSLSPRPQSPPQPLSARSHSPLRPATESGSRSQPESPDPTQYYLAPMDATASVSSPQFGSDPASLASPQPVRPMPVQPQQHPQQFSQQPQQPQQQQQSFYQQPQQQPQHPQQQQQPPTPQPLQDSAHPFPYAQRPLSINAESAPGPEIQTQRVHIASPTGSGGSGAGAAPPQPQQQQQQQQQVAAVSRPATAVAPSAMPASPFGTLSAAGSGRTQTQVDSLALLNEALRAKLEEFRLQNLENVNVADAEIAELSRENQDMRTHLANMEQRVLQLQDEKALLLRGHGPTISKVSEDISALQNQNSALTRDLLEAQSKLRVAEDRHSGEVLLLQSDMLALRNQIASLTLQLQSSREESVAKSDEIALLQSTLVQVSADYDRMSGTPEDQVHARSGGLGTGHNLHTSTYIADSLERARLLKEKQAALAEAELKRAQQLAKDDALNQALIAEGGAQHSGNLAAVVTSLQESRQLLRLYQVEYSRQEGLDEAAAAERYLLDHEKVAVRFIRLKESVCGHKLARCMDTWREFLRVVKRGRQLKGLKASSTLDRFMQLWKQEHASRKRGRSMRGIVVCRMALRAWRKHAAEVKEAARLEAQRQRAKASLAQWALNAAAAKAQRLFLAKMHSKRQSLWFDAWRTRCQRVLRAAVSGKELSLIVRKRTLGLVLQGWKKSMLTMRSLQGLHVRKLARHVLAWSAFCQARKRSNLALVVMRNANQARQVRQLFHAWFAGMQRQRLRALSDSNVLLSHDLGVLSSQLKVLAQENRGINASLIERMHSDIDAQEKELEYAKKEEAYQLNFQNEMALREKIKDYERREYDLSQSIHDTKHMLSAQISTARGLNAQLHSEQTLRQKFMRDLESTTVSHRSLLENLDLMLDQTAKVMLSSNFQNVESSKNWIVSVTNRLRGMLQSHHAAAGAEMDTVATALMQANASSTANVAPAFDSPRDLASQVREIGDRALASSPTKAMFAPQYRDSYIPPPLAVSPSPSPPVSSASNGGGYGSPNATNGSFRLHTNATRSFSPLPPAAAAATSVATAPSSAFSAVPKGSLHYPGMLSASFRPPPPIAASAAATPQQLPTPSQNYARSIQLMNQSRTNPAAHTSSQIGALHTPAASNTDTNAAALSAARKGASYEAELERELQEAEAMTVRAATKQQASAPYSTGAHSSSSFLHTAHL